LSNLAKALNDVNSYNYEKREALVQKKA